MEWVVIIQLIMKVLTVIMEFLGGGAFSGTLIPNETTVYHLAQYEWQCENPYWSQSPLVQNNEFKGTVEMNCEVYGADGGGLIELRRHMSQQLPLSVSEVVSGPAVNNFQGLPSDLYQVRLNIDAEDEQVNVMGETQIATNGFTELRNVFQSTATPTSGNARYLKSLTDEVRVTKSAGKDGWYNVTMIKSSRVARPWFVSSSTFKKELTKKNEEDMVRRQERVLNDIAAHL